MALHQLLVVLALIGLASTLPPDPFGSSSFDRNWFEPVSPIIKKLPVEDKSFKKSASPAQDTAAYCQEISSKDSKTRCYKCKDPGNGMNYEHCSYDSARTRPPSRARGSRSNKVEGTIAASSPDSAGAAATTYRFGEDYFRPESTSAELEPSASGSDGCKRERRDTMLCMVCRDPKTNGKYEQCSYVGHPHPHRQQKPKARPHREREAEHRPPKQDRRKLHGYRNEELEPEVSGEDASEDKEGHATYLGYPKLAGYEDDEDESPQQRSEKLKSPSGEKACKNVRKNGESCTVCTDPNSGAKSEKCNYSFEPKDKAYAYTKSKSFGYPDSSPKAYKTNEEREEEEEEDDDDDDDDDGEEEAEQPEKLENSGSAEDYSSSYASPDYIRSESERISKKVASKGDCREEKRDGGMICKVCKDPRTGDDFERCNYSYEPDDKLYAYSKSKHFGSASPSSSDEYGSGSSESAELNSSQPEESSYSSSVLDYLPKPSASQHSNVYSSYTAATPSPKDDSRVDSGFYDASVRRAEIERIVEEMGAHDRSKCSKSLRDGMTCYSCRDDKGFSDEECVYVTEADASKNVTRSRRSSEAEPYDYVAETRPMYDKVLGLSLPAYMLEPSPQEMDFDLSVENSKF